MPKNRQKKISAKISKLVKEGYPQKQAVAIAYSMLEKVTNNRKKKQGGKHGAKKK